MWLSAWLCRCVAVLLCGPVVVDSLRRHGTCDGRFSDPATLPELVMLCMVRPWLARGQLVPAVLSDADARCAKALRSWEDTALAFDIVVRAHLDLDTEWVILREDDGQNPWIVRG